GRHPARRARRPGGGRGGRPVRRRRPLGRGSSSVRSFRRHAAGVTFEELVDEGRAAPVEGWGFEWFDGRATEERPGWHYLRRLSSRMAGADAALDLQTGGGEVLAEIPRPPRLLVATEGWP